jgi:membrane fusion protein, multidrug efflux system
MSASLKFVLLTPALGLLVACSGSPVPSVSAAQPVATETTQSSATPAPEPSGVMASGPIIVENQVDVTAQREGVVAEIVAQPGARVSAGQLLAKLDDRQLTADLEAARAKTRSVQYDLKNWEAEAKVLDADYARAQKLWAAEVITKEQLDHARYKAESDQWDVKRVEELLANAQSMQRSLELELEKTRIKAPFSGVVARRYVRAGQTVAKDERLFWVTATAPLRVRVTLPARFMGQIKVGSSATITAAESAQTAEYRAKVLQVSPVVDPSSDTIEVLAELSGAASGLQPGMRADVHFPKLR